jgi:hypothetical protein
MGQIGVELEVGVLSWLSVETVPMFVADETPPWLNFGGGNSRIYQHSNGWGALAGASLGVNFWPTRLFKGYVIRVGLVDHALDYETKDATGRQIDEVSHTKRELYALLGSMSRLGPFTIGGGIGLGYDLNKETRCYTPTRSGFFDRSSFSPGDCDEIDIGVPTGSGSEGIAAVTPFTYPWEILARFSLGVTID